MRLSENQMIRIGIFSIIAILLSILLQCEAATIQRENSQCILYEKSNSNEKTGIIELGSGDYRSIYNGFKNDKTVGSVFVKLGCQLTVWKGKIALFRMY